ncbi:nuclear transport factor 2 family protein [Cupriavidus sp. 30B13]|uniref:nuclear transport factor 2 family protein n=1 Tax=Cupriavidus sp. 30B13 TaxID=3384241 RepID=UPI003B91C03C
MSETHVQQRNKQIVSEVMAAVFVERQPQRVLHYFSDNYIQHNPVIPDGKEAIPALIAGLPEGFGYEPGMLVADGNLVMIHGRYTGWGPRPMVAVDIFRLEDGRLAEHWDVLQEEVPAAQTASGNGMFA